MKYTFGFLAFLCIASGVEAQDYVETLRRDFAARINVTGVNGGQDPRVAGSDHRTTEDSGRLRVLSITASGGKVMIDGTQHRLSARQCKELTIGMAVDVATDYLVTLSSDVADRNKAVLLVQSAKDTKKSVLSMSELRVVSRKEDNGEQGGAGQPATRSESDFEGGDKPQLESEGRSR